MVLRPEYLKDVCEIGGNIEEKEKRIRVLNKELQSIEKAIDNIIQIWSDKMIDKKTFDERFTRLKERKDEIEDEIPKLQGERDFLKVTELSKEYILDQAKIFSDLWPSLNDQEKRRLIETITDSITIGNDSINIIYYYLPDFMVGKKNSHRRKKWSRILTDTRRYLAQWFVG